jgi:hypothetical protein
MTICTPKTVRNNYFEFLLKVIFFEFFLVFFFNFAQNLIMNGWICKFESLNLYNRSAAEVFQQFTSLDSNAKKPKK